MVVEGRVGTSLTGEGERAVKGGVYLGAGAGVYLGAGAGVNVCFRVTEGPAVGGKVGAGLIELASFRS